MKKLNYLILGLAGLTLASCSQDEILEGAADGNCLITVSLPSDMATRAIGDNATAASLLNYAIFETDGTFIEKGTANFPEGEVTMTLPLNLTAGASYKIAFFAQDPASTNVYSFNANDVAHSVTVEYGNMESALNNSDGYDCFYNLLETGAVGTDEMINSVTLNRIVAQVNWGTSDFNKQTVINSYGSGLTNLRATLTTNAYGTFDLLTKEVSDEVPVTISDFTPDNEGSFPVSGYDYVGMQYLLVPASSAVYNLDLQVANTEGTASTTINVANAPVQANYRTNIYGALLTDQFDFTVTLSSDWNTPDFDLPQDAASLISALENGGNVVLGSDIYLPTFPTITEETTLDLNGYTLYYDFTLPIQSDDHMIVVDGGSLTITGNGAIADNISYPDDNKNTLIYVTGNGTVNIENGDFSASGAGQLIYVESGTANINGGTFKLADDYSKDNWCINCKDGTYNSTSFVNVKGGMFYDWNPADSNTEPGGNVSYLAEGYQSVKTTINNETWYVVVPQAASGETVTVAASTQDMATAISNATGNTTIYVPANTTLQLPTTISNKTLTIKGLDPESTVIDAHNAYWTYQGCIVTFEDLTLVSFVNPTNHTSMGFKNANNQTFQNVTFDGEMHIFSGNATFTDCTFNYVAASGTNYQLWCETAGTVDINNCVMNCNSGKALLVYGEAAGATGGDVNIDGLNVTSIGSPNDKAVVEIHSENYVEAKTITIKNVTYPVSYFGGGLWREINNNSKSPNYEKATHYYTIYVNCEEEQDGTETGPQPTGN